MHLAHLGVAVFVIGVTLVKGYEAEKDVRMARRRHADDRRLRACGCWACNEVPGPELRARSAARSSLRRTAGCCGRCSPEKRAYFSSQMPMTEAAIDTGLTRDIYVSLGEPLDGEGARRVERARPLQAVRRLDLGRLPADGARRLARRFRPALPSCEAAGGSPQRDAGGVKTRFLMTLVLFLGARRVSCCWGCTLNPREVPSPLVGKAAPAFCCRSWHDRP